MSHDKVRIGVVGLGKMGMSHFAIVNAQPGVETHACDASKTIADVVERYSSAQIWSDYNEMLEHAALDAVVIAVQSSLHGSMVRQALDRGLHVFCEKPLCLDWRESEELALCAEQRGVVNQVGYHYRYVGAFREMKRLIDLGAIGEPTHLLAEAYGPVVLRRKGSTWRTKSNEGGGCLYDYAAHPINLVNWIVGQPSAVSGTVLNRVFSAETDDEVYSTFSYPSGLSVHLSVNWSDDSYRKMSTKVSVSGTNGRLTADRQELQVYLRRSIPELSEYVEGWNVKYTTELTDPVGFYLRGEEYSAQIADFVASIRAGRQLSPNTFASSAVTDRVMAMMLADRAGESFGTEQYVPSSGRRRRRHFSLVGRDRQGRYR